VFARLCGSSRPSSMAQASRTPLSTKRCARSASASVSVGTTASANACRPPPPPLPHSQVLVELTALLLLHVVRKCEGNPNARQATSMLL
jgi:hypothetical protein